MFDILPPEIIAEIAGKSGHVCQLIWPWMDSAAREMMAVSDNFIRDFRVAETQIHGKLPYIITTLFGKTHSFDDLPAVYGADLSEWWCAGQLHRVSGYAITCCIRSACYRVRDGVLYVDYDYAPRTPNNNGTKCNMWFTRGSITAVEYDGSIRELDTVEFIRDGHEFVVKTTSKNTVTIFFMPKSEGRLAVLMLSLPIDVLAEIAGKHIETSRRLCAFVPGLAAGLLFRGVITDDFIAPLIHRGTSDEEYEFTKLDGKLHSFGAAALTDCRWEEWWHCGIRHRADGPAITLLAAVVSNYGNTIFVNPVTGSYANRIDVQIWIDRGKITSITNCNANVEGYSVVRYGDSFMLTR